MTVEDEAAVTALTSNRSKFRRASWNLIDQILSALTNVVLSFLVARNVSAAEFGAFSVAFLLFSLMIGISRSLVGTVLSIRHSGEVGAERIATARAAFGTVLSVTAVASLALLGAGALLRTTLGSTLIALAVVLPFLILQDTCRMAFFAWARPQLAALNDAVWAVLQISFVVLLVRSGHTSAPIMVLAWGFAAAPAAILGMAQLRAVPVLGHVRAWIKSTRGIVGYLLAEYLVGVGTFQGGLLLIGGLLGLSDIGSLRAAQILIGPLGIVATATNSFGIPEVARLGRLPHHAIRIAALLSSALAGIAVIYVAVIKLIPESIGVQLLGQTWSGARTVLLPVAAASVLASGKLGPVVMLYGRGLMRATFRLQVLLAVSAIAFMSLGAYLHGVVGLAWGTAAAQAVVVPLWFITLATVVRHGEARYHGQRQRVVLLDPLSWASFSSWGPALHRRGLTVLRVSPEQPGARGQLSRIHDRIVLGAWPRRITETGLPLITPEFVTTLFDSPTVDVHASEPYMQAAVDTGDVPVGGVAGRVPDPTHQRLLYDKLTMTEYAASLGCGVPRTWSTPTDATYPLAVKRRSGAGGLSVRLVNSPDQLRQAERELDPDGTGSGEDLCYQEAITGDSLTVGGVAHDGRVLVQAIYQAIPPEHDPQGPAEWLCLVESPAILNDVTVLLASLSYSGAFCLDFLVDSDGRHALIDFNSRIFGAWLPLQLAGIDLLAAYASLFGLADEPSETTQPRDGKLLRNRLLPSTTSRTKAELDAEWRATREFLRAARPVTGRPYVTTLRLRGWRSIRMQARALRRGTAR